MQLKLSTVILILCAVLLSTCNSQDTLARNPQTAKTPNSSEPTTVPAIAAVQGYLKKQLKAESNTLLKNSALSKEDREAHVQIFEQIASWLNGRWSGEHLGNSKWQVTTVHSLKGIEETKSWLFDEGSRIIQEADKERQAQTQPITQ